MKKWNKLIPWERKVNPIKQEMKKNRHLAEKKLLEFIAKRYIWLAVDEAIYPT